MCRCERERERERERAELKRAGSRQIYSSVEASTRESAKSNLSELLIVFQRPSLALIIRHSNYFVLKEKL